MEPIQAKQTKNQIADIIRNEIITGGLEDGMLVTQMYIAVRLYD